jgi:hypothetical protein
MEMNMKKYLFFVLVIFIIFIIISCKSETPVSDYIPYNKIPDNYSLDDAKTDNCVVFENDNIISGQFVWDNFIKQTEKNEKCFVRLVFYYTRGFPEWHDPDYYDWIANENYPLMFIQDLKFDGKTYNISWSEDIHKYSLTYQSMDKFTEEQFDIDNAALCEYTYYALVNDKGITQNRLFYSLFNMSSGGFRDYQKVYSKYEYKK